MHTLILLLLLGVLAVVQARHVLRLPKGDRLLATFASFAPTGVVTLAQAKMNAADDIDRNVIDEFAKSSYLLATMPFDDVVTPDGPTLTTGYTRKLTQRTAGFRAINTEYTPQETTKTRITVDLKPLGGSFQIDRVLARIGGAALASELNIQMTDLIQATRTTFADAVILGDVAVDANGFDGLDKILTGSSTELNEDAVADWRGSALAADTAAKANDALDLLDEWLATLDGPPSAILANRDGIARLRSLARRAGFYERTASSFGAQVESYRGIALVDLGEKAGSSSWVVPSETRTVDGVTGTFTDLYAVRFGVDGFVGLSMAGAPLVQTWMPDFTTAGAVKTGEVEMGPVAVALKKTKAAGVLRNVQVR